MTKRLHEARLHPWRPGELKTHLGEIVDALGEGGACSPLQIALELLDGELSTFLLVGRMGHLDPPRADGKIAWAVLHRKSEDGVDDALREALRGWLEDHEEKSE